VYFLKKSLQEEGITFKYIIKSSIKLSATKHIHFLINFLTTKNSYFFRLFTGYVCSGRTLSNMRHIVDIIEGRMFEYMYIYFFIREDTRYRKVHFQLGLL
jgi:hypothetical protein